VLNKQKNLLDCNALPHRLSLKEGNVRSFDSGIGQPESGKVKIFYSKISITDVCISF